MRDVSRETLETYANLIREWSSSVQLVSRSDLHQLHDRHIADSLQAIDLMPQEPITYVDIGSGGGFPAIPLLIARKADGLMDRSYLIDADKRKAAFLRSAIRTLELNAKVLAERIERVGAIGADIITARALASLENLIGHASVHLAPGGRLLAFKGRTADEELKAAQRVWSFDVRRIRSRTADDGWILEIGRIARR